MSGAKCLAWAWVRKAKDGKGGKGVVGADRSKGDELQGRKGKRRQEVGDHE